MTTIANFANRHTKTPGTDLETQSSELVPEDDRKILTYWAAYWFPNRVDNERFPAGEGHILGRSVSTLLSAAINRAGLHGHRPHQLRAATATHMHRAGVDAFTIQSGMRHTQMDTTNRYLLIDPEQVRRGLETLPTISKPTRSARGRKVVP